MVNIRLLRTAVAVHDCGSVSGAARSAGYSAAAISRQLGTLQRELGVPLFVPRGRGVTPTAEMRRLVDRVRPLLAQADDLDRHLRAIRARGSELSGA
jgi:DNA-binding transcriptional LysR family regulator